MKILVGFSRDENAGTARKFRILDETVSGKYVITPLRKLRDVKGKPYLVSAELYLRGKEEVTEIYEEEIDG